MGSRGVTLVEVVVSVALLGLLSLALLGQVSFSLGASRYLSRDTEIEDHVYHGLLFMEDYIGMQSRVAGIRSADSRGDGLDSVGMARLGAIEFECDFIDSDIRRSKGFGIYLKKSEVTGSNCLKYRLDLDGRGEMEFANHVGQVYVEPLPEGSTYRAAGGIRFTFVNVVDGRERRAVKSIYMKNGDLDE